MSRTARLIIPALRSRGQRGFEDERSTIDEALALGVGGFCIFGGDAASVRSLTAELRARSRVPLLIASDVERGAGQQFAGATPLPPLAALGSLDDPEITRRAAALTAREALALGVNWLFAPVADVDLETANPIVGSRSFGADAMRVAAHVSAWISAAQAEGVLCCAKHFPGHGRTVDDSHVVLPRVRADRAALEQDAEPFRAAVRAGVGSVMTAHVIYDALDAVRPATLSPDIIGGLLRDALAFDGLVVTDGLGMEGLQRAAASETDAAIAAVNAGCDALLYPTDLPALASALAAEDARTLDGDRVTSAVERIDAACARVLPGGDDAVGAAADIAWADDVAVRTCRQVRGRPSCAGSVQLLTIDEDTGGPYAPPSRDVFTDELRAAGAEVRIVTDAAADAVTDVPLVIAVFSDVRASKTVVGLSLRGREVVQSALDRAPDATVVVFGHARLCERMPGSHVLAAWGGEPVMQRAAARWLTRSD